MEGKVCTKCGEFKSFEHFRKNKSTKTGYHYSCKLCNKPLDRKHDALYRQKEGYNEIVRKSYRKNKDKRIKANIEREKERCKINVEARLKRNCRNRIWHALKNIKKVDKTHSLLGCSVVEFKQHLESKFEDWMTWENYGKWEIDHIIPCSKFDLTLEEEQRKCFHYTNLQPLESVANKRKSNKYVKANN